MLTLLRVEWVKLYRRKGTYVSFALLLVLVLVIAIPIRCYRDEVERDLRHQLTAGRGGDWVVGGKMLAGPFMPRLMLFLPLRVMVVNVLIALFAAMVAGGSIAGEYSSGTLRTILVRPPSRSKVYLAKGLVAGLHACALSLSLGLAAFGVGYALFGPGDLTFFDEPSANGGPGGGGGGSGLPITPQGEAVQRLALSYVLMGAGAAAVATLALFLSSFTSHSLTATGVTLGILLVSGVLGTLGSVPEEVKFFAFFRLIRPYLLTTHMSLYEPLLVTKIAWDKVLHSGLWLAGYALVCGTAGLLLFRRREILC